PRAARHAADLAGVGNHDGSGLGDAIAVDAQADELPRNSSVAPVQHADDHFLSDIAALREADGARLDPGFERNRLLVHVAMKERDAAFDAQRLRRALVKRLD